MGIKLLPLRPYCFVITLRIDIRSLNTKLTDKFQVPKQVVKKIPKTSRKFEYDIYIYIHRERERELSISNVDNILYMP